MENVEVNRRLFENHQGLRNVCHRLGRAGRTEPQTIRIEVATDHRHVSVGLLPVVIKRSARQRKSRDRPIDVQSGMVCSQSRAVFRPVHDADFGEPVSSRRSTVGAGVEIGDGDDASIGVVPVVAAGRYRATPELSRIRGPAIGSDVVPVGKHEFIQAVRVQIAHVQTERGSGYEIGVSVVGVVDQLVAGFTLFEIKPVGPSLDGPGLRRCRSHRRPLPRAQLRSSRRWHR